MEWPWQYNFPPFFTLQPNEDTRRKQLDAWSDLIISYCKQNRVYELDLAESVKSELFSNKKIDRKCSSDLIKEIIDYMVKQKRAEWLNTTDSSPHRSKSANNKTSQKCLIFWHTLDEWAKLIYEYVDRTGMRNTVCTFYELTESNDAKKLEFYKMSESVLKRALQQLQSQGKAEIFQLDEGLGVKFF